MLIYAVVQEKNNIYIYIYIKRRILSNLGTSDRDLRLYTVGRRKQLPTQENELTP